MFHHKKRIDPQKKRPFFFLGRSRRYAELVALVHRTFDRLESGNGGNSEMFEAVMQQHGDGLKGLGCFTHRTPAFWVMMNFRQIGFKKKGGESYT